MEILNTNNLSFAYLLDLNTLKGVRKIFTHYDLGNDFYEL